jgi:hypothetical protein
VERFPFLAFVSGFGDAIHLGDVAAVLGRPLAQGILLDVQAETKRLSQLCIVESLFIGFIQRMGKSCIKQMMDYEESVKPNKV